MKYLVRVRVTRVHEHEIEADSAEEAGEIGEDRADEGSVRDSFDEVQFLDVTEDAPSLRAAATIRPLKSFPVMRTKK